MTATEMNIQSINLAPISSTFLHFTKPKVNINKILNQSHTPTEEASGVDLMVKYEPA